MVYIMLCPFMVFFKHMESHHRLLQGELLFIVLLIVLTIKRQFTLDASKYPKITV